MVGALRQLGVGIQEDWQAHHLQVAGCSGSFPSRGGELFLGNAGTAMRCAQVCFCNQEERRWCQREQQRPPAPPLSRPLTQAGRAPPQTAAPARVRPLHLSMQQQQHGLQTDSAACRPLTAAVAAAGRGDFVLDGVPRMRERPIQDLVSGLQQLGVQVSCPSGTGCPPVHISARGLPCGEVCPARSLIRRHHRADSVPHS